MSEQRQGERLTHPVMVAYRTQERFLSDFGTNISAGGVFVNSREPAPVGSEVTLRVALPDEAEPFEVTGRVTRVVPVGGEEDPGMAVAFVDLDPAIAARIGELVGRLKARLESHGD